MRLIVLSAALLAFSHTAGAACPSLEDVARFDAEWSAARAVNGFTVDTIEDAVCARDRLVALRTQRGDRIIGYKAALTSDAAQKAFAINAPVTGALFDSMLIPSGSVVSARFGIRPLWEADMLLVVKDDGINRARTPEGAIKHIRAMRPFIELPDLVLPDSSLTTAQQFIAINAAARLGVAGPEHPLPKGPKGVRSLAKTTLIATDETGKIVSEGVGSAMLGNPLNAVLFVARDLASRGQRLKAGDLVSVGAIRAIAPRAGQRITLCYEGLPQSPSVTVTFN